MLQTILEEFGYNDKKHLNHHLRRTQLLALNKMTRSIFLAIPGNSKNLDSHFCLKYCHFNLDLQKQDILNLGF